MNSEQNELSRARNTYRGFGIRAHSQMFRCLMGPQRDKAQKQNSSKKNLHYSVRVSLWICLFLLCVERKSLSDLGT